MDTQMLIPYRKLDPDLPDLEHKQGNWVDVRVSRVEVNGYRLKWRERLLRKGNSALVDNVVAYEAMDRVKVGLGFAMVLPSGFEAELRPRSSLFKRRGLLQTNSIGVIDSTYCGDGDEWFVEFVALFPGALSQYERIAQFKINMAMPQLVFNQVTSLGFADRDGHGSSGVN